jgi:hypothetical protein
VFERARRDADGLLVIAPDGKVLRGAWTDANDKVTLFSAMICGKGVTVAQTRAPDGTNEITQVEPLLDGLATDPEQLVVVTLDAARTQRETAEHLKGERAPVVVGIRLCPAGQVGIECGELGDIGARRSRSPATCRSSPLP